MKSPRVLQVPDGRSLVDALSGEKGGWWQASGFVEEIELRVASEGADRRRDLRGRHTLVSLSGPAGGPYSLLLARAEPSGFSLAAGELVSARSAGVRALFIPALVPGGVEGEFEDTSEDAAPPEAPRAAAAAQGLSGWAAQAAQAASEQRVEEEPEEQAEPERGDLVHHFAFGWCEVLMVNGDRLKLRDITGPGRIREVAIDRLDVRGPTEKDGKRAFKLTRRA
jgi:hypothetical protein